jgi:hypothetical protein
MAATSSVNTTTSTVNSTNSSVNPATNNFLREGVTWAGAAASAENLRNQVDRDSHQDSRGHDKYGRPAQRKCLDGPTVAQLQTAIMNALRSGKIRYEAAKHLVHLLVQADKDIPALPKGGRGEQLQLNFPIMHTSTPMCFDMAAFETFATQAVFEAATHATLTVIFCGEATYATVYLLGLQTVAKADIVVQFVGAGTSDQPGVGYQRVTKADVRLKGRQINILGVNSIRACVPFTSDDRPSYPGIRLDRFETERFLPSMVALGVDKHATEAALLAAIQYLNKEGYEVGYHAFKWWVYDPRNEIDDEVALELAGKINDEVNNVFPSHGKFLYSVIRPCQKPLYLNDRSRKEDTTIIYLHAARGMPLNDSVRPAARAWLAAKGITAKSQKEKEGTIAFYVNHDIANNIHKAGMAWGYFWHAPEVAKKISQELDRCIPESLKETLRQIDEWEARTNQLSDAAAFTYQSPSSHVASPPVTTVIPPPATADARTESTADEAEGMATVTAPSEHEEQEPEVVQYLDLKKTISWLEKRNPRTVPTHEAVAVLTKWATEYELPEVEMANQPDYAKLVRLLDKYAVSIDSQFIEQDVRKWLIFLIQVARNADRAVALGNACARLAGCPLMMRQGGV